MCIQGKYPQEMLKTWAKFLKKICECAHFSISGFNPETMLKYKVKYLGGCSQSELFWEKNVLKI